MPPESICVKSLATESDGYLLQLVNGGMFTA